MIASIHIPAPHEIKSLCEGLLGRDVGLSDGTGVVPGIDAGARVALYIDDVNLPAAAVAGDLAFCAYAAAALGLVPAGGASASIEDGFLSPLLDEIVAEVFNVLASTFNIGEAPHLRLAKVYDSPVDLVPAARQALTSVGGRRADHQLDIAGYGSGRITIVAL
ncbi:hypothetical protein [Solicola sp. PLA-1-18]|uniref:hypothetical protein n=1 Tax=Solicola sp. PLA-1-18 TaxID=3380532 RepID=UPI003B7BF7ED